jgi:hypothetical protein
MAMTTKNRFQEIEEMALSGQAIPADDVLYICRLARYHAKQAADRGRSRDWNDFYWVGIVRPISQEWGETEPDVHDILKQFLPGGKESTRHLTREESAIYAETCIQWAAENLGLVLFYPDELEM